MTLDEDRRDSTVVDGVETKGPIECPKCYTRMKTIGVDELHVDQCHRCGGLWINAASKEQLLADPKAVKSIDTNPSAMGKRQDAITEIKCPLDHSTMIRMSPPQKKQVHYESCTICGGMFFDAGELREMTKVSLGQRLRSLLG